MGIWIYLLAAPVAAWGAEFSDYYDAQRFGWMKKGRKGFFLFG